MATGIRVQGVTKTYGDGATAFQALKGVDLDGHPGEVLLMVGPSGSGKTTLLSIMGAILRASSGRVEIAGRDIAGLPERDLPAVRLAHLGFVDVRRAIALLQHRAHRPLDALGGIRTVEGIA